MVRLSATQPKTMEFRDPAGSEYSVWVSPAAIELILTAATKAGRRETGGILIGRYDPEGWIAEVVEATGKPHGSRAGLWWFNRGNGGLQNMLEERWAMGQYYLGEWHFHPGGAPIPSDTDKRSMWKIAADPVYQCSAPVLMIIGGKLPSGWTMSASVFRDRLHIPLRRA